MSLGVLGQLKLNGVIYGLREEPRFSDFPVKQRVSSGAIGAGQVQRATYQVVEGSETVTLKLSTLVSTNQLTNLKKMKTLSLQSISFKFEYKDITKNVVIEDVAGIDQTLFNIDSFDIKLNVTDN